MSLGSRVVIFTCWFGYVIEPVVANHDVIWSIMSLVYPLPCAVEIAALYSFVADVLSGVITIVRVFRYGCKTFEPSSTTPL